MSAALITTFVVVAVVLILVVATMVRTVKIVPQAQTKIVERLGRYARTLTPGVTLLVPFVDRVRSTIDMREQVVAFPPQPVITEDNLTVNIDTVVYFQVTDPRAATYEIANFVQAMDLLTVTTLRNVIGGMHLEQTLTSRDQINSQLRGSLDDATGKWGIRVNRVEIKAIDPPPSVKEAMEKQMRAERDKRAAVLISEGQRQSAILTAEGEKQAAILRAEASRQSQVLQAQGGREAEVLRAQGQAQAIETVFDAVHRGGADPAVLAYQYLQTLPKIAAGDGKQIWVIPGEFTRMLEQVTAGFAGLTGGLGGPVDPARASVAAAEPSATTLAALPADATEPDTTSAVAEAEQAVQQALAVADTADLGGMTVPGLDGELPAAAAPAGVSAVDRS